VLALVAWLPSRLLAMVMIVVIGANAIGTHQRNQVWRTEESLWTDVVEKSPANGRAWMNYGLAKMARGDYATARASFDRAAQMNPAYSTLEINRGIVEGQLGNPVAAEQHFRRALQLQSDANGHFFYARWLTGVKRGPEAVLHLHDALKLSPGLAEARSLLLMIDAATGDPETNRVGAELRAMDPANPALKIVNARGPSYESAFNAGLLSMGRRDWMGGAIANRDALRQQPRSADAYNNLGWCLQELGFTALAAGAYEQALAIAPQHERARNNLALLRR